MQPRHRRSHALTRWSPKPRPHPRGGSCLQAESDAHERCAIADDISVQGCQTRSSAEQLRHTHDSHIMARPSTRPTRIASPETLRPDASAGRRRVCSTRPTCGSPKSHILTSPARLQTTKSQKVCMCNVAVRQGTQMRMRLASRLPARHQLEAVQMQAGDARVVPAKELGGDNTTRRCKRRRGSSSAACHSARWGARHWRAGCCGSCD